MIGMTGMVGMVWRLGFIGIVWVIGMVGVVGIVRVVGRPVGWCGPYGTQLGEDKEYPAEATGWPGESRVARSHKKPKPVPFCTVSVSASESAA